MTESRPNSKVLVGLSLAIVLVILVGAACFVSVRMLIRESEAIEEIATVGKVQALRETMRLVLWIVVGGSLMEILLALYAGYVVCRDANARHRAVAALEQSESALRSFYESGVIMMGVGEAMDAEFRLISLNSASATLLKKKPHEVVGKLASEVGFTPQFIRQWLEQYHASAVANAPSNFECYFPSPWGDKWLLCAVCRLPKYEREIFSFVIRDITSRKLDEEERKRYTQELITAKEAIERQAEQLEASRQVADAANAAKTAFLANMSHEIRTPITAILGYAETMLDPAQPSGERDHALQVVRQNARHLMELINDVLDLSKIEAGKMTIESIPANPAQIVYEAVSIMRPRAQEKNLPIQLRFEGAMPARVRTDPLRLRQVLMNLLSNAVKFTGSGQIGVRVWCVRRNAGEGTLMIEVQDSGIGMNQEQIAKLFRPFTQADETTTRKFGGTGLGLAISRNLVELLGGTLAVRSECGQGSVFTVTIPTGDLTDAHWIHGLNESMLAVNKATAARRETNLKARILLVEDGRDNQRLFTKHLSDAGAEVVVADNGRSAIELATNRSFNLILMDMQMPEMDGYEATRELRRRGVTIPIIALTAHAMAGDRERCIDAGCTEYFAKPIEREQLLCAVADHLSSSSVATPRPPAPSDPSCGIRSEYAADPDMQELIVSFVSELPADVSRIKALLEQRQYEELRRAVHQLKGAGGGYGFSPISRAAAYAEEMLRAGGEVREVERAVMALVEVIRRIEGYPLSREVEPCLSVS